MSRTEPATAVRRLSSSEVYADLRTRILGGEFGPGDTLKPQTLASSLGVSLSVVRESLQQLLGEGLAERRPNRGFFVPDFDDERWQQIAEARSIVEPTMIRMAIERGDLNWEAGVRAAHHRLVRTPVYSTEKQSGVSAEWAAAHHQFHRALLEGCGNPMLLDSFERLWSASRLARQWAGPRNPTRDFAAEHQQLEEAALSRDADRAAEVLARHVSLTAASLTTATDPKAG